MKHGYTRIVACTMAAALLAGCASLDQRPLAPEDVPLADAVQSAESAADVAADAARNAEAASARAGQAVAEMRQTEQNITRLLQGSPLGPSTEEIHLVRYVGGRAAGWPNTQNLSGQIDQNYGFADLYARFLVISASEAIGAGSSNGDTSDKRSFRSYRTERPGVLARIFTEEERSIVAVAKISVLNPSLEMTVPLYSMSYNSGGESGEAWATSITASHVRSPLFRITGNSRFTLNVKTSTSDATQSSGFSTAISALTSAVELVAPEAGVLTTLSDDAIKGRANALDSAISDLLSYSISEEIDFGRMLSTWKPGALIWLDGCAPFVRAEGDASRSGSGGAAAERSNSKCANDRDLDGQKNHYIGSWRVMLSCPQFSVFSSRSICKSDNTLENIAQRSDRSRIHAEIAAAVPDSLILEEPLGENATIRSLIRGKDFFIAFVDVEQPTAAQYGLFCASVMDALRQAGLTGLDSALGLRATLRLMPEFVGDRSNGALTAQCRTLLQDFGVTP